MCMKKGEGPRCSHHTRAVLSAKVQALKKVLAEKAANPDDASLNDKLMSAKHELYEAKVMLGEVIGDKFRVVTMYT